MKQLSDLIRREITAAGPMRFARFMELALYCPEFGYYEREAETVSRRGDFYTSVSVGGLFGELLAFQFAVWLERMPGEPFQLVEAGAHDGQLAKDVLGWLRAQRPPLWERLEYWILEPSERARGRQAKTLAEFGGKVRWFCSWEAVPAAGVSGVIFSNELLDALPVHRLGWDAEAKEWFEWGVGVEGERFVWVRLAGSAANARELLERAFSNRQAPSAKRQAANADRQSPIAKRHAASADWPSAIAQRQAASADWLSAIAQRQGVSRDWLSAIDYRLLEPALPDGFTTEVCPGAVAWWQQAAAVLRHGRLLTFDYRLEVEDFLTPARTHGTLRAYQKHHATADLLANVGDQDLTAHVNFAALRAAGEQAGLRTEGCGSQASFLTRIAEATWSAPTTFGEWTPARRRQFQTLTHPDHLGRAFNVLVQSRGG
ncbi:MAG: SAM-dependent methyltransferase [Verrucomicrobia bacterium]|nr:SAM-dependent methyltransferase [Verrucomicrobiota bacterium]